FPEPHGHGSLRDTLPHVDGFFGSTAARFGVLTLAGEAEGCCIGRWGSLPAGGRTSTVSASAHSAMPCPQTRSVGRRSPSSIILRRKTLVTGPCCWPSRAKYHSISLRALAEAPAVPSLPQLSWPSAGLALGRRHPPAYR